MEAIYVVSNLAIFFAWLFACVKIVPRLPLPPRIQTILAVLLVVTAMNAVERTSATLFLNFPPPEHLWHHTAVAAAQALLMWILLPGVARRLRR